MCLSRWDLPLPLKQPVSPMASVGRVSVDWELISVHTGLRKKLRGGVGKKTGDIRLAGSQMGKDVTKVATDIGLITKAAD